MGKLAFQLFVRYNGLSPLGVMDSVRAFEALGVGSIPTGGTELWWLCFLEGSKQPPYPDYLTGRGGQAYILFRGGFDARSPDHSLLV